MVFIHISRFYLNMLDDGRGVRRQCGEQHDIGFTVKKHVHRTFGAIVGEL